MDGRDLDGMMERRLIRILTVYSRTLYFVDKGVPRGTAYDQGKLLEEALNKKLRPGQLKVSVQICWCRANIFSAAS